MPSVGESNVVPLLPKPAAAVRLALLAGGLGTRLGWLTAHQPKALVPVAGRPFLEHQLALLARHGIREVVICTGHFGNAIAQAVGSGERWSLRVQYCDDGLALRGTAGALRQALPLLGEMFWVLYGDSYLETDYFAPLERLRTNPDALGVMTVCHNRNQWDRSNVAVQGDRVVVYDKSAPSAAMEHVDFGLGVLRADALREGAEADLADIYRRLATQGRLLAHPVEGRFYEIGSPAGLADTEALLGGGLGAPR